MSLTKVSYSMVYGDTVNVAEFGATTSDTVGSTNLAAIQAAIDTGKSVMFSELYTVNDTIYVNEKQRLFADRAWRETNAAGINFKFDATANKNCITGKDTTTRSLQGCVFENLQLRIDRDCTFTDTITVNMISGAGRFIQITNCWSGNYSFSQLAQGVTSITSSGTTATVTKANHGLSNGDVVRMVGVSTPEVPGDGVYNGIFTIQNVTTNTFDYVMSGTPTNATANINTYKSGYFPKRDLSGGVTGTNINFSSFLYLDSLKTGASDNGNPANYKATFELLVTGCTTGNYYRDILLQGRSPTTGSIGLIVAPIFYGNQFNSINPDYSNFGGNIQGSNISNLMLTNNIYGSLANNIYIAGDSDNISIANNYYEGGNSGCRRISIGNNTVNTLVNEFSIAPNNGSIWDNSTPGTYTAYTSFGMQLNGGSLLNRYEEGVWTPQYEPTTGAFTSITYGYQNGKYVIVGNEVTVTCLISVDSLTVGTGSGIVKIVGLPFTIDWAGNGVGTNFVDAGCYSVNWASASVQPNFVRGVSNTTYVTPQIVNSGATPTALTVANMATAGPGVDYVSFTMTYKVL